MHRRIFLALLLAAGGVVAGEPATTTGARNNYRVEVLLFRVNPAPTGSEDLSAPAEGRGFDNTTRGNGPPPAVVRLLEPADLRMSGTAQQLRSNAAYTVLAHAGWIQTTTPWGQHLGLPLHDLGIDVPELSGELFLERGELLHFGAQLRLVNGATTYTLSELRRVRFNERHYLDNPAFGLIVEVNQTR
jgi:hypothetical protein